MRVQCVRCDCVDYYARHKRNGEYCGALKQAYDAGWRATRLGQEEVWTCCDCLAAREGKANATQAGR